MTHDFTSYQAAKIALQISENEPSLRHVWTGIFLDRRAYSATEFSELFDEFQMQLIVIRAMKIMHFSVQ